MLRKLMEKINPRDVIAVVVIIGCMTLIGLGKDGFIGAILISVVAYYYGHERLKKRN